MPDHSPASKQAVAVDPTPTEPTGSVLVRLATGQLVTFVKLYDQPVTITQHRAWIAEVADHGFFTVGNSIYVPAQMDFAPHNVGATHNEGDPVTAVMAAP